MKFFSRLIGILLLVELSIECGPSNYKRAPGQNKCSKSIQPPKEQIFDRWDRTTVRQRRGKRDAPPMKFVFTPLKPGAFTSIRRPLLSLILFGTGPKGTLHGPDNPLGFAGFGGRSMGEGKLHGPDGSFAGRSMGEGRRLHGPEGSFAGRSMGEGRLHGPEGRFGGRAIREDAQAKEGPIQIVVPIIGDNYDDKFRDKSPHLAYIPHLLTDAATEFTEPDFSDSIFNTQKDPAMQEFYSIATAPLKTLAAEGIETPQYFTSTMTPTTVYAGRSSGDDDGDKKDDNYNQVDNNNPTESPKEYTEGQVEQKKQEPEFTYPPFRFPVPPPAIPYPEPLPPVPIHPIYHPLQYPVPPPVIPYLEPLPPAPIYPMFRPFQYSPPLFFPRRVPYYFQRVMPLYPEPKPMVRKEFYTSRRKYQPPLRRYN